MKRCFSNNNNNHNYNHDDHSMTCRPSAAGKKGSPFSHVSRNHLLVPYVQEAGDFGDASQAEEGLLALP